MHAYSLQSRLGPIALLAALGFTRPWVAHAVVIIWNPASAEITMPDATDADVVVDITYEPCSGTPTTELAVSGDLLDGVSLNPPSAEICGVILDPGGDVQITGFNAHGEFEITIDAAEFDVTGDDLPKDLPFTVVSGTVTSGPVLDIH